MSINIIPNSNDVNITITDNQVKVVDDTRGINVNVVQPTVEVIRVLSGPLGIKGDAGPVGPSGSNFPYTGSAEITGSLTVDGTVNAISFTGSLKGTSSWSQTASYSLTSSYVENAQTASYAPLYVLTSTTSSMLEPYVLNSTTSSFTTTSSFNSFTSSYTTGSFTGSFTGSLFGTSSWAENSISASYTLQAVSSSYSSTSSYANQSLSSSLAQTASYVQQSKFFGITVDGQGQTVPTGSVGFFISPTNISSTTWYLVSNVTCSAVIDVLKNGTSMVGGGNKPTLSTQTKSSGSIVGWTTSTVNTSDTITYNVISNNSSSYFNLNINGILI